MNAAANIHAGVGAGKFRRPWRIREFLAGQGLQMADVGRELNISRQVVTATVSGTANNRKVLGYLQQIGCPVQYLSLPADMI